MTRRNVLQYSTSKPSQATVRRQYERWRAEQGLPLRCDNSACVFHRADLAWNGLPLRLILDHVDGNRLDNRPEALQFLCPNCDSQLHTRGGGNRGRVTQRRDGFTVKRIDGSHKTEVFFDESVELRDEADATVVKAEPTPDDRCGRRT